MRRRNFTFLIRGWRSVRHEFRLQTRLDCQCRPAEQGEDGAVAGERTGDVAADYARCADDGAVFACEGEGHFEVFGVEVKMEDEGWWWIEIGGELRALVR